MVRVGGSKERKIRQKHDCKTSIVLQNERHLEEERIETPYICYIIDIKAAIKKASYITSINEQNSCS